ncbi:FYN-binding protein 1 [Pristis pectinata]|uniref:FYN-binding protein 1 n=1 Tax=Pristis pectinata TaxID=685728 RepID=UPI00223D1B25|nr:FYN-binding protein 1 [Pristis pectinata]
MNGKSDVKTLLARFDDKSVEKLPTRGSQKLTVASHTQLQRNMSSVASKAAAFESSSTSKFPLNRTTGSFSEKPSPATDKPAFPKPSAVKAQQEAKEPKPPFPKPSVGIKHSLNTFNAQREEKDEKSPFAKFGLRSTADAESTQKENEVHPTFPKPSAFSKPLNPVNSNENKLVFSKNQFVKPNSQAGNVSTDRPLKPTFPKPPGPKPWNDHSSTPKENTDGAKKEESGNEKSSGHFPLRPLKPVGEQAKPPGQGGEDKVGTASEVKSENLRPSALKSFPPRAKQEEITSAPSGPSKFMKLQSQFQNKVQSQENEDGQKDPNAPKRKSLPALWTLGPPPQKPNRPPTVNLEQFRKPQEKQHPPTPVSHREASKLLSAPGPPVPNLPPRPMTNKPLDIIPTTEEEEEENYDDVQCVDQVPPPLPPVKPEDRRRQMASNCGEEKGDSDGEMYEDLDSYRSRKELKEQERKREKEEKRRQEQEKKEQKEKKREQEMRKKFKFSGPIEVIQTVKVTMDYKGGKNELSCKQGDFLEVIRITDNPEGKWLARGLDGSYGYIKVTCVDINYDEIRKKTIGKAKESAAISQAIKQPVQDQELYDDVAPTNDISIGTGNNSASGSGAFPPPPISEEIYDDVDEIPEDINPASQDASKFGSWSWGLLKKKKLETDVKDKKAKEKESSEIQGENSERRLPSIPTTAELAAGEDVYDDVGADDFPPPPPEFSLKMGTPNKGKKDEKDPKKIKKLEKEEKDFRKKFKYDGEIRVLGTTQVAQNISNKKWGNRDLPVKAGEILDIIQHTDDIKLLCRNEDGKFGYVQKVNLVTGNAEMDGEIYDDIDAECIYDND